MKIRPKLWIAEYFKIKPDKDKSLARNWTGMEWKSIPEEAPKARKFKGREPYKWKSIDLNQSSTNHSWIGGSNPFIT